MLKNYNTNYLHTAHERTKRFEMKIKKNPHFRLWYLVWCVFCSWLPDSPSRFRAYQFKNQHIISSLYALEQKSSTRTRCFCLGCFFVNAFLRLSELSVSVIVRMVQKHCFYVIIW